MFSRTGLYEAASEEEGAVLAFGLMRTTVPSDPSDTLFTVPPGGDSRMDAVSDYHYGTPELWWVIAQANNIIDPLTALVVNSKIRIPTRARLASQGILNV